MRDVDIRRALLDRVRMKHAHEPDTRYLEELGICGGASRADVAVVNGSLHCYEIKSEHDSLSRLPSQRLMYDLAFDYVTIVTCHSHVERILASQMIPEWWGLLVARKTRDQVTLRSGRKPNRNPKIEKSALVQFLWREEVMCALEERNLAAGRRAKSKKELWNLLAEALTVEDLSKVVRDVLKSRQNWKADLQQA